MHELPTTVAPLLSALPKINTLDQRWKDIARKLAQVMPSPLGQCMLIRPASHLLTQPLAMKLIGTQGELEIMLDAIQWPELMAACCLPDLAQRNAVIRILMNDITKHLKTENCPFKDFRFSDFVSTENRPAVGLRIGDFDIDLMPHLMEKEMAVILGEWIATRRYIPSQIFKKWPCRTTVTLGRRRVGRAKLLALKCGDGLFGGMDRNVTLHVDSPTSHLCIATITLDTQDAITMKEPFHKEAFEPDDIQTSFDMMNESNTLLTLAEMPMHVHFEIAGPTMTVAQAASLAAGDVVALPVSADHAIVNLRCQGRVFAQGELVNIGGQLGVRITATSENEND